MARSKNPPVTAPDPPATLNDASVANSKRLMKPSRSKSSSSATSTCPHCKDTFEDLPAKDFRYHVASCRAESTDDDSSSDSDSSVLSPPPDSPSVAAFHNTITVDDNAVGGKGSPRIKSIEVNGNSPANGSVTSDDCNPDAVIRPYVDPEKEFAYYDKAEDREASVITRRNSEDPEDVKSSAEAIPEIPNEDKAEKIRHPFPKFTSIDAFEDYLGNHEEMSYDDLYHRTAMVADVLVNYQKEWDAIGQEIEAHEAYVKAQSKIAADKTKASEDEKTKVDDQKYLQIAQSYKKELKYSRSDWEKYLDELSNLHPEESDVHECLRNLRNPTFVMALHKRQKVSHVDTLKLANKPMVQERITKEEIAIEKRKRYGRLLDQITFDDMVHADAYGFNYSSQPHHVGNQPQPSLYEKAKTRGVIIDEGRGGRTHRAAAKRSYDADKSVTPETDDDELPAKRARKVRNLDAGLEFQSRPRSSGEKQSRSGSPQVRVFPSGKRVGRPPTKSKLKEVHHPPTSASPTMENGSTPRMLAPKQEELLHESVENLVNQTQPHHRNKSSGFDDSTKSSTAGTSRPSTSSSQAPRSRKPESNNTEPDTLVVEPTHAMGQTFIPPPVPTKSRKRKVKEEEIDESLLTPEELEARRKKQIKSQKLSDSLRKRWQKGEMATAMESRKATNAKKKAAKLEAKQVQQGAPSGNWTIQQPPWNDLQPHNYPVAVHQEPATHGHPPVQQQFQLQSQVSIPAAPVILPPQIPQLETQLTSTPEAQGQTRPQADTQTPTQPPPPPGPPAKRKYNSTGRRNQAKNRKAAAAPPPPPPRPIAAPAPRGPSKRTRRPTRLKLEGDDANTDEDDEDDEEGIQRQIKRESKKESEYDRYQALTSPGHAVLGKRVRKSKIDLAAAMGDGEDDDEYYSS